MSDHLDGLTAKSDPRLDISDVYLFHGRTGTVLVMNTNPGGSNGFHHEAVYEFKIDIDGDAHEEFTLRATFGDRDWRGRQEATLTLLSGPAARNRNAKGVLLARTTTGKKSFGDGGIRFFAGPAGDPFYIEPTVVTAVRTAVLQGTELDLSGYDPVTAKNLFADKNVQAIAVEIPDHFFHGLTIGLWGAIAVPTDASNAWRQTDRAAIPLVSTLFGFNEADDYGAAQPAADDTTWGNQIQSKIAKAVEANSCDDCDSSCASEYAAQLRALLLPDILRYHIGTPAQFTEGRRNGRNLTENVAEEMFHLLLRKPVDMGLGASSATGRTRQDFPYLSTRRSGRRE